MENTILRPKTKQEVDNEVKKLSTFEFVDKFFLSSIKGMKVGFKKRLVYTLISSKSDLHKKVTKFYWVFWFVWLLIMIYSDVLFPTSDLFMRASIDIIEDIFWCIIMIYFVLLLPSMWLLLRFQKWKMKKMSKRIDLEQHQIQMLFQQYRNEIQSNETNQQ